MTCMCGDTECPSCGLAQGTLDERDALRAALDDERGLRAALFKYARITLFDPRNPLAYPLEHNPHAIGSKNAQADIERCLRAAIAGAAKVDKTEASK